MLSEEERAQHERVARMLREHLGDDLVVMPPGTPMSEESRAMEARIMEGAREMNEEAAKMATREDLPYPSGAALRGALYDPYDLDLSEEELKRILGDDYQYFV